MKGSIDILALVGGLAVCGGLCYVSGGTTALLAGLTAKAISESLTPNLFSDLFSRTFERFTGKPHDPHASAKNHDLRQLAIGAIRHVIDGVVTESKPDRAILKEIDALKSIVPDRMKIAADDVRFAALWEENIVRTYFSQQADQFQHVRSLTVKLWQTFVGYDPNDQDVMRRSMLAAIATRLHQKLPGYLVGAYREAFEMNPHLLVAIQTSIFNNIWETVRRTESNVDAIRQQLNAVFQQTLTDHPSALNADLRVYLETLDWLARETREAIGTLHADVKIVKTDVGDIKADVELLVDHLASSPPPPGAPPRSPDFLSIGHAFVGRGEAIKDLHAAFATSPNGIVVLHGPAGIGKTRLAIQYAIEHQADYNGLLYVNAATMALFDSGLAGLDAAIGLRRAQDKTIEARLADVERWLRDHSGWLLVVDNVNDPAHAGAVIQRVGAFNTGRVLITSWVHGWPRNVRAVEVKVLPASIAARYLLEESASQDGEGRIVSPDDAAQADALAIELGGYPVALEQAATYLRVMGITLKDYLVRWRALDEEVRLFKDKMLTGYDESSITTFLTSFNALPVSARRLLEICGLLGPAPIPLSLLAHASDTRDADVRAITRLSLAKKSPDGQVLILHQLVQESAAWYIDPAQRADRIMEAADAFRKTIPAGDLQWNVAGWPIWKMLVPHAGPLGEQMAANGYAGDAAIIVNQAAIYLQVQASYSDAELLIRQSLAIAEASLGERDPSVANYLTNLARLLEDTGRLQEAEQLVDRAIAINDLSLPPEHPNRALGLYVRAKLWHKAGELKRALTMAYGALAVNEAFYGDKHPRLSADLILIAAVLDDIGEKRKAEKLLRRAMKLMKYSACECLPQMAIVQSDLALLFCEKQHWWKAEPLMRRALAIDEAYYHPHHPEVATRLNNLAQLLGATGRIAEAEPMMRRVVQILIVVTRAIGRPHPNLDEAIKNCFAVLMAMGKTEDEAIAILREMCPELFA